MDHLTDARWRTSDSGRHHFPCRRTLRPQSAASSAASSATLKREKTPGCSREYLEWFSSAASLVAPDGRPQDRLARHYFGSTTSPVAAPAQRPPRQLPARVAPTPLWANGRMRRRGPTASTGSKSKAMDKSSPFTFGRLALPPTVTMGPTLSMLPGKPRHTPSVQGNRAVWEG